MSKEVFFSILSVVFALITFIPYLYKIIINKVKPHFFTWLIWFVAVSSIFFAQLFNNAGIGCWSIGLSGFFMGLIFVISYVKKNENYVKRIDYVFLFLSLIGLFIWYLTSNAFYAVIILTIVDIFGYMPTIRKAYINPFEEDIWGFIFSSCRNIFSLLAIKEFSLINSFFQISIILANTITVLVIIIRRNKVKN